MDEIRNQAHSIFEMIAVEINKQLQEAERKSDQRYSLR